MQNGEDKPYGPKGPQYLRDRWGLRGIFKPALEIAGVRMRTIVMFFLQQDSPCIRRHSMLLVSPCFLYLGSWDCGHAAQGTSASGILGLVWTNVDFAYFQPSLKKVHRA